MDNWFFKHYKNILDNISFGVFTVDNEWKITFFNKKAEEIMGVKHADVIGRRCCDVFRGELCPNGCYIQEAISSGKDSSRGEVTILNYANKKIPITITGSVLKDENGNLIGGIGSFRDRFREVTLEKKLKESYTIDDFVGGDEKIQKIFETIPTIAESLSNVLVLGETGTGKDLLA